MSHNVMVGLFIPFLIGFCSSWIRDNSFASSIHSGMENISGGNGFSSLQSLGISGSFIALIVLGLILDIVGNSIK